MLSTKLVSLSALFQDLPHFSNPSISVHYHKFAVVDDTSIYFILPLPFPCIPSLLHMLSTESTGQSEPRGRTTEI